jgi:hypothetical protein
VCVAMRCRMICVVPSRVSHFQVLAMVRGHAFCRPPCLRVFVHRKRLVLAATAGDVKVEQPDCGRTPPPHYCFALGARVTQTMHDEMVDATMTMARAADPTSNSTSHPTSAWPSSSTSSTTSSWSSNPTAVPWPAPSRRGRDARLSARLAQQNETTAADTALWARAAVRAAALGTCALPPAVSRSARCGEAIRLVRAHPAGHNLASGVRFGCPSSIHRYLVACRPEAGCVRAAQPWYLGREEFSCGQRAVLRREQRERLSERSSEQRSSTSSEGVHGPEWSSSEGGHGAERSSVRSAGEHTSELMSEESLEESELVRWQPSATTTVTATGGREHQEAHRESAARGGAGAVHEAEQLVSMVSSSAGRASVDKRHNWQRHQCERLASLPPTDSAGAPLPTLGKLRDAARAQAKGTAKTLKLASKSASKALRREGRKGRKKGGRGQKP